MRYFDKFHSVREFNIWSYIWSYIWSILQHVCVYNMHIILVI